jgi:hypothetical protein
MSSLVQNNFHEWIPTLIRYLLYISTFIIFFYGLKNNKITINHISRTVYILAYILIIFGYYQILSGNINFVNGAYRVSGNFTTHHLAFALSSFVVVEYLFFIVVLKKENATKLSKIIGLITTLLLLYLFIQSHSRLLLAILLVTNLFVFIYYSKRIITKFIFIFISILFIALFFYIALKTDLLPRFNEMLTSDKIDSSTLYRLFIIDVTFSNMSFLNYITGIGLGGFNEFFFSHTGITGTAAHNDYLLILVEGGVLSILLYLSYQFILSKKILSYQNSSISKLSFILFVGIEILAFLQNPHYFYQSELLIPIVLAILFSTNNKGITSYEKNLNVSTK